MPSGSTPSLQRKRVQTRTWMRMPQTPQTLMSLSQVMHALAEMLCMGHACQCCSVKGASHKDCNS